MRPVWEWAAILQGGHHFSTDKVKDGFSVLPPDQADYGACGKYLDREIVMLYFY